MLMRLLKTKQTKTHQLIKEFKKHRTNMRRRNTIIHIVHVNTTGSDVVQRSCIGCTEVTSDPDYMYNYRRCDQRVRRSAHYRNQ